jgi:hypothetical protein
MRRREFITGLGSAAAWTLPHLWFLAIVITLGAVDAFAQDAVCPGGSIPLDVSIAATPHVRMQLAGRSGNFLVDTGASASSVDGGAFSLALGSNARLEGSTFPTITGGSFAVFDWSSAPSPPGGLAGVIGTDFLSLRMAEFHYDAREPYLGVSGERCPPRQFEDVGFTSISQDGHYSSDPTRLRPNTLNIPVVFIRVGSVVAPAQIDSGFSETSSVRGVVQINEALLAELRNAGIAMIPFTEIRVSITDCRGNVFVPALWQVKGAPLQIATHEGKALLEYEELLLEVKPTPTPCGGIATSREPMGQIGAEYLRRWGTFVLDPFNERVWLKARMP